MKSLIAFLVAMATSVWTYTIIAMLNGEANPDNWDINAKIIGGGLLVMYALGWVVITINEVYEKIRN